MQEEKYYTEYHIYKIIKYEHIFINKKQSTIMEILKIISLKSVK